VCSEWKQSKEAFFEWAIKNGYAEGMELDRRDVDGDYHPANCRFIPHRENSQLRSNARCTREQAGEAKKLLAAGMAVREVADTVGIPYMSVWHISKGNTWHNA
jgi:DNA invertase Pin-like site-specific DNA recombinase